MKTIAICNHKGGVGKTALSMAIAEGLHRKGKRTLLVDLDQQMNATQQAKIDTTDEVTVGILLNLKRVRKIQRFEIDSRAISKRRLSIGESTVIKTICAS